MILVGISFRPVAAANIFPKSIALFGLSTPVNVLESVGTNISIELHK
jgi:hypothetical protein